MKVRTSTRLFIFGLLLTCILFKNAFAHNHRLSSDGTVHWTEITSYTVPGMSEIVDSVVHHQQFPDGTVGQTVLPGMDNLYKDHSPELRIDPVLDTPVIIWVRDTGEGDDLFISRLTDNAWSAPLRIRSTASDEQSPAFEITTNHIHLRWEQSDGQGKLQFYRLVMDRQSLTIQHGPERIQIEDAEIAPEQDDQPDFDPPSDLMYEGSIQPPLDGSDGRIFVWGIRDEPVPVGYLQSFLADPQANNPVDLQIVRSDRGLVVSYVSGSNLFYRHETGNGWIETRRVQLKEELPAAAARREILRSLEQPKLKAMD